MFHTGKHKPAAMVSRIWRPQAADKTPFSYFGGDNTKIVLTGDIYQIDTPYLDSQSNGLSYLIDRAQNHPLAAHVTLTTGQRSELANLANELL